jgi:hypothetical protein
VCKRDKNRTFEKIKQSVQMPKENGRCFSGSFMKAVGSFFFEVFDIIGPSGSLIFLCFFQNARTGNCLALRYQKKPEQQFF